MQHLDAVTDAPKPATSTAVPMTLRNNAPAKQAAPLVMRREGLAFDVLQTATCPACGMRPAQQVERFTLHGYNGFVDVAERLLSPLTVMAAAILSSVATETVWWPFVLVFGPSAAISTAATVRLGWAPRHRLKVALCASCAATIRAARKKTRAGRLVKNASSWALVMLAPLMFMPDLQNQLAVLGSLAGALAVACSVAHQVERRWRKQADALLPTPTRVADHEAQLTPPASWMGVLQAEAPALLQLKG